MAHRRRRQPQRARRRVVPEAGRDDVADGDAAAAPARRAGLLAQHLQPGGAEHVRRQHPRPRAGHRVRGALRAHRPRWHRRQLAATQASRERHEGRHGADPARADAGHRRQGLSRLPDEVAGPKIEPAFEGIMCAYNYYCGAGDTAPGGRPRVKPGDTVLVHAGLYAYHYEFYANQTTSTPRRRSRGRTT